MVVRRKENLCNYNSMWAPNIGELSLLQPQRYLPQKPLCKVSPWKDIQDTTKSPIVG